MKGLLRRLSALFCGVALALGGFACSKEKKKTEEIYYKVSFEENGGKEMDEVWLEANAVFSPAAYRPVRTDYVFDGWFLDAALSQPATDFTPTGDLTVYAKWLGIYELCFQSEGVAIAAVSVTEGEPIQAPPAPTRENYAFEGWYTDERCEEAFEFGVMPAEDTTLYAKWRELALVRFRFYLNFPYGNGYDVASTKQREGSSPDLSGIENEFAGEARNIVADMRLGTDSTDVYRFVGWAMDADGETPFDGSVPYSLTEVKLYAIWERTENYCRIIFTSEENPDVRVVRYSPKGEALDEDTLLELEEDIRAASGDSETERTGFYTAEGRRYDGAPVSEDLLLTLQ